MYKPLGFSVNQGDDSATVKDVADDTIVSEGVGGGEVATAAVTASLCKSLNGICGEQKRQRSLFIFRHDSIFIGVWPL